MSSAVQVHGIFWPISLLLSEISTDDSSISSSVAAAAVGELLARVVREVKRGLKTKGML